jgi:hypothetical protein
MEPRHCGGESIKVSIVKFSPMAMDVVATAAFDWTVKIWNLDTAEVSLSRSPQ